MFKRRGKKKQVPLETRILMVVHDLERSDGTYVQAWEISSHLGGGLRLHSVLERLEAEGLLGRARGSDNLAGEFLTSAGRAELEFLGL